MKKSDNILEIPINYVIPDPKQPRKTFHKETLEELADSIKNVGILNPLLLEKISSEEYKIIVGERRCKAAKIAGLQNVRAQIIENLEDWERLEIQIIEDSQEPIPLDERAEAWWRLYNMLKIKYSEYNIEKFSERIGKSESTIRIAFKFHELDNKIKKLVSDDILKYSMACELSSLEKEKQYEFAVRAIISEYSHKMLKDVIRGYKESKYYKIDLEELMYKNIQEKQEACEKNITERNVNKITEVLFQTASYLKYIRYLHRQGVKNLGLEDKRVVSELQNLEQILQEIRQTKI